MYVITVSLYLHDLETNSHSHETTCRYAIHLLKSIRRANTKARPDYFTAAVITSASYPGRRFLVERLRRNPDKNI
jgi:hypothetical protein